ncbi:MAG: PASTA domain-containing protein [Oscillospiraceae bacterium]|nr:PASTA domain-containing protein [Oscillospiraceae bacterium]
MKKGAMKSSSLTGVRGVFILVLIAVIAFGGCIVRIGYLTLIKGEEYKEKAEAQQLSVSTISASRGTIYDANMNVLAQSASVWLVYINPSKVTEKNRSNVISVLSDVLGVDAAEISRKIDENSSRGYLKIKGEVEYTEKKALSELVSEKKLTDVIFVDPDTKRYYPNGSLASTILGFTGTDGNGLYGLENIYDDVLTGTNGRIVTAKDGVQFELENAYEVTYEAEQGLSLVLTLNVEIQTILENALETALQETGAKNVYGIVMETKTGAILAVANLPDYDANNPYDILYPQLSQYFAENGTDAEKADPVAAARIEQWKNKSVADFYYPGSVFKVFVVSGALEEGVITRDTPYHCVGTITVGPRSIKDYNPTGHGAETPRTLLVNSCNTFAVYVGQKMGVDLYFKYFQAFGFAEKTGVDLAGESTPLVNVTYHDPSVSFSYSDLASASFGQSIAVTPLQIITGISAIGNGGKLMQPYIVSKLLDSQGNTVAVTSPTVKRQVVSESTASLVASWMEDVVTSGTGKNAYVSGYHVAGKTGTSEKLGSSDKTYIASIACFAPCDDPEISVVIIIDEPQGANYSGGVIAAPVAGEVIEKTLNYLGVEPSYSESEVATMNIAAPELLGKSVNEANAILSDYSYNVKIVGEGSTVVAQSPEPGRNTPVNGVLVLYTQQNYEKQNTIVPDFSGLTVSQANKMAVSNDLNIKISGSASSESTVVAYKQDIESGEEVEAGSVITVSFRTTTGVHD